MSSYSAEANRTLSLHWTNDQDFYDAVIRYSVEQSRRMRARGEREPLRPTPEVLGINARDKIQSWCITALEDPTVCVPDHASQWGEHRRPASVRPALLIMLADEMKPAGGRTTSLWSHVDEAELGEELYELVSEKLA